MNADTKITNKLEDYLEAVWRLQQAQGHAHVQEIADIVGVHKSTVTTALQSLVKKDLVNYHPYRTATVTEKGEAAAREVERKHRLIRQFMISVLYLDVKTADENACRIEHALGPQAFRRLAEFMAYVQESSQGAELMAGFQNYLAESLGERETKDLN